MTRLVGTLGVVVLASAAFFSSGCVVDDCVGDECNTDIVIVGDLEVAWSIENEVGNTLCDDYGIDHWIVTATGPQPAQLTVDCYDTLWDTDTAFYLLEEGLYNIDVAAVDYDGYDVGGLATDFDLYDTGMVETVEFVFYPSDLGF